MTAAVNSVRIDVPKLAENSFNTVFAVKRNSVIIFVNNYVFAFYPYIFNKFFLASGFDISGNFFMFFDVKSFICDSLLF